MDTPPVNSPVLKSRVLRALAGSIPGIGLGLLCYIVFDYGTWPSIIVGVLGAFIGAALAQPDVSKTNVLKGTAGTIAAHNAPGFMKQRIIDAAFKDASEPPQAEPGQQSGTRKV